MILGGSMLIAIAFLSLMVGAVGVILGIDYGHDFNQISIVGLLLVTASLVMLMEIYRSLKVYETIRNYLPNMYTTPLLTFAIGVGILARYWRPIGDEDVGRALGIIVSFTGAIMFLVSLCFIDDEIEEYNQQQSNETITQ